MRWVEFPKFGGAHAQDRRILPEFPHPRQKRSQMARKACSRSEESITKVRALTPIHSGGCGRKRVDPCQKPVPPVNINQSPLWTKMGGAPNYPKLVPLVLTHSHMRSEETTFLLEFPARRAIHPSRMLEKKLGLNLAFVLPLSFKPTPNTASSKKTSTHARIFVGQRLLQLFPMGGAVQ